MERKLAVIIISWLLLLSFHFDSFGLGYYGEDFSWLQWAERFGLKEVFESPVNAYFRPLSVRLPYYFFARLPSGIYFWKFLTFGVIGLSSWLLFRWLERLCGKPNLALALAVLWMHAPFHVFALYYVNAFDYALYPFALIGFLWALGEKRYPFALLFLIIGLGSKEAALAFPAVALFARPFPRWRFHLTAWGMAIIAFVANRSLYSGAGQLAGFTVGSENLVQKAKFFFLRIFWNHFVKEPHFSFLWFVVALAVLVAAVFALAKKGKKAWLQAGCIFMQGLILFFPMLFLSATPEFLGGVFWIFLFGVCAIGAKHFATQYLKYGFALGGAILLVYMGLGQKEITLPFRDSARAFAGVLEKASPHLDSCKPRTQIVLRGLPKVLSDQVSAEHGLWALYRKYKLLRFYLVKEEGVDDSKVIEQHRPMWVEEWRTEGHPMLQFARLDDGEIRVTGAGELGCGE